MTAHRESVEEEIQHKAAEFINRESNRKALITVTRTSLSNNQRTADIFVSVLPEEQEANAILFLKRMRSEFRDYLKKTTRLQTIPTVDFIIDFGEKNRRRLNTLSQ